MWWNWGLQGYTLFFLFLPQNIDSVYSFEPPQRGGSNKYPQSIFWVEIWKISKFFFYLKIFSFCRWNVLYICIDVFSLSTNSEMDYSPSWSSNLHELGIVTTLKHYSNFFFFFFFLFFFFFFFFFFCCCCCCCLCVCVFFIYLFFIFYFFFCIVILTNYFSLTE